MIDRDNPFLGQTAELDAPETPATPAHGFTPHVTLGHVAQDAPLPAQRVGPVPLTFPAITLCIGGARKEYPLTGAVGKYSEDQARDKDGKWSGGGASTSSKVELARRSAVLADAAVQRVADKSEAKLSRALGVPRTANNSAFDLRDDEVGIEVKTMLTGKNGKLTMSKAALGRKLAEAQAEGLKTFTVVADLRGGRANARYYVSDKLGSLRLGSMTPVSLRRLRDMVTGR